MHLVWEHCVLTVTAGDKAAIPTAMATKETLHIGGYDYAVRLDERLPVDKLQLVPTVAECAGLSGFVRVEFQLQMHPDLYQQVLAKGQPCLPPPETRSRYARDRRATLRRQALGLPGRARYRKVR